MSRREADRQRRARPGAGRRRRGGDPRQPADDPRVRGLPAWTRRRPARAPWPRSPAPARRRAARHQDARDGRPRGRCASFRERGFEMPVLIITGHGDVATAVEATRRGAFDFFEKPLRARPVCWSACATPSRATACAATPATCGYRARRPDRLGAGDGAAARDGREGGADPGHGADHRRERHRQGAGGPRPPRAERPPRPAASCRSTARRSPRS